ncbi:MAG TPA: hypothetical protein VNA20_12175 [Frankiaceae bacterium]|nr:hypothetical protein [Frankiaceae bacterium]
MKRERLRVSRAGVVGISLVLLVSAAGTAAYSLSGRRDPAAAGGPVAEVVAVPVSLTAKLAPRHVTYGAPVVVTGTLTDETGTAVAGREVEVVMAPATGAKPTVVTTAVSDGAGAVEASFKPRAGADVWLRFPGAEGLAEATSSARAVGVSPRVTVAATTVRTKRGWTTALRGTVTPATPGAPVRLYKKAGPEWHAVSAGRLSVAGRYSFTVRSRRPGLETYRVTRPADVAYQPGDAVRAVRLVPSPPPAPRRTGNGGPRRLLVAGDSFAFYLGQQLTTARGPRETVIDSRHSSGLSRPDFFDWHAAAGSYTGSGAVVVFVGANDCQPIRLGGTGRWVTLGSVAWIGEYRRRAAEVMRAYGAGGRSVYWVGLPIVRKPDIAACYRDVNAATAGAATDVAGVTWVDSWSVYAVDGAYSVEVGGVVARQDDGIHLTFEGTRLLTRKVYALLRD